MPEECRIGSNPHFKANENTRDGLGPKTAKLRQSSRRCAGRQVQKQWLPVSHARVLKNIIYTCI